ncbi:hypothetical protein GCM10011512_21540 [Tersicoccus solisilvae]|uniref:DUF3558 domain-containing protein n=1 Tax=Tersicoccus solisilvae TaxID=1882339 RepID=A0ABQ1PBX4_9MICC|nr:hypothetical protein GCM10011512_21540 [Tersicoccus solisilvae]
MTGAVLIGATVVALAGCAAPGTAAAPAGSPSTTSANALPTAAPSTSAPGPGPGAAGQAPAKISMICSDREVLDRITTLAGRDAVAGRSATWVDGLYTCRYPAAGGALVISVKQPAKGAERAWFDQQRSRYPGITTIEGLTNFGLPGAGTDDGVVLFLNDGMTLTVDARQLTDRPAGRRAEDAYALASVVIACWRHDSF